MSEAATAAEMNMFSSLSDDIILNIFHNLEDDPRHWARLACVCTKFCSLIRNSCCRTTCTRTIPSDLLPSSSSSSSSSSSWASLHKLSVCCPGPLHAGLLLDTSDFGLHLDLGPEHPLSLSSTTTTTPTTTTPFLIVPSNDAVSSNSHWSLFDDLYYDTVYDTSESESQHGSHSQQQQQQPPPPLVLDEVREGVVASAKPCKKRKVCGSSRSWSSHLASGTWTLSREQGSKLLARQFRDDCLYICDWPGCVHSEEKRKYRLFRGVFKNFKRTRVWRTINDGKKKRIDLGCAFCLCEETWDLLSAFCLRRDFGYHDDGEPVVRAFVCENGHVSGAWTDVPMYT